MKVDIISAVPQMLDSLLYNSILQRGIDRKIIEIVVHNLRDWTTDKHKIIDDTPYGGGPGMILKADIVSKAIRDLRKSNSLVIYTSPRGKTFNQNLAREMSTYEHLIILCGHYKGMDERAMKSVDMEISVGDYILSGGEIPATLICDAVLRLVPGVMSDIESANGDSFENILLDCAYYTRPYDFEGEKVPDILCSGNHKEIEKWRLQDSIEITKSRRPDLYELYKMSLKNKNS